MNNNELHQISKRINKYSTYNNSKKLYETIRKETHQSSNPTRIKALTDRNGTIQSSTSTKLRILKDKWASTAKKTANYVQKELKLNMDESRSEHRPSFQQIKKALQNLKPDKAAGIDTIVGEMLSDGSDIITNAVTEILQEIYDTGIFPLQWKTDKRIPLFKKGSKTYPGNYRPIALHSVFRKIYAEIIHNICIDIIKIHPSQFGFQKNRRCSDLAAINQNKIYQHFKNKNLGELYIAAFDFSKAYDSVDHTTLFQILHDHGISGKLLKTIQAMYESPQAKIFLRGMYSDQFTIERGVAQGCELSTLHFNVYINPLLKELELHAPSAEIPTQFPLCYADDLVSVAQSKDELQKCITILESWCKKHYIDVNSKKSGILTVNVSEEHT